MSQPLPDLACLRGNFAPILMECDAHDLPVTGELPRALHGTLYRNGPNPRHAPRDNQYHWFLGDGMIHAFALAEGRVTYRNRWVRTNKFALEQSAGHALFGSWGNPATTDPAVADQENGVANTHVLWHGGRLLALEEADLPVALDPHTLETLGPYDYGGELAGAMTAHPKIDPVTGEMVFFAYALDGPFTPAVRYGVVGADGALKRLDRFEAPFPSMIHDFSVTQRHVVFPILPLTGSMDRAMRGESAYLWEPGKGTHIGILPRNGNMREMRWFRNDACFVFHTMNAWDDGHRVIVDVMQFEAPPMFNPAQGETPPDARLCRWIFDLSGKSDTFTRAYLDDTPGEFPRIDDRFATLAYRHAWFALRDRTEATGNSFNGLAHVDTRTGKCTQHVLARGDAISEPVFVPRAANAAEGDGWLLATIFRGAEMRSDLAVYDATAIDAGPVATVALSHRVPFGFHGSWRAAG